MNEKIYKTMGVAGVVAIVVGIIISAVGVVCGVVSIVFGGRLLKKKEQILL